MLSGRFAASIGGVAAHPRNGMRALLSESFFLEFKMKKKKVLFFDKRIRVCADKGEALAAALVAAGVPAVWEGPGTARSALDGGCSDPGHCPQHRASWEPQKWGSVTASCGGNKAHRIWRAMGLVGHA